MALPTGRKPYCCVPCGAVFYSKGALTQHENAEHWDESNGDD